MGCKGTPHDPPYSLTPSLASWTLCTITENFLKTPQTPECSRRPQELLIHIQTPLQGTPLYTLLLHSFLWRCHVIPSRTLWGPFLYIYKGPCNIGASFGAPQIEQYICLSIGSCLVEDCGAIAKQWPEEHLLQEREPLPNVEHLPNSDPVLSKQDWSFWLIESQLSQCMCIVKLRTMSHNNGKQLVRSGMCSCKTGEWRSSPVLSVINHFQSR